VRLPPLRERPGDLEPLTEHLLGRIGRQLGRPDLRLAGDALQRLREHRWPGNVRELSNALERAAILTDGAVIEPGALLLGNPSAAPAEPAAVVGPTLADAEREAIRRALEAEGGNRKRAAARLGIGLRTLYDKIKQYELS